ncbi:hypothetical protein BH20ACT2_BH20ACT2_04140 [soil metagenome]
MAVDEGAGYAEALAELETILDELDDETIDVDVLAARVRRAAELVRWCRGRISEARVEIDQIVADLDTPEDGADQPT